MVAPMGNNKIHCRGDSRIARFVLFNYLNEQGLGGPCELATAKARFILASTVYPQTNKSI